MISHRLGHYHVEAKLGEGGMGVVYRARDAHLDRSVAIKVLTSGSVDNEGRKQRFVQEAKAASALNHPNILHVYDVDTVTVDGQPIDFIAMELVDGRTLEELIGRKGLPLRDVLKYAAQIAAGLAAAHAGGIVHRDLKPGNVMITGPASGQAGLVKIVDFGIAKLREADGSESAPTKTIAPRTEQGTILGTVAYMSPEQTEGQPVDARSDIFSFGAVLYEMVTGRQAFRGPSSVSTLAAILHQEPTPVTALVRRAPAELEKLVTRCLRKNRERRIQHMDDVKLALEDLLEELDASKLRESGIRPSPSPARRRPLAVTGLTLAVALASALLSTLWMRSRNANPDSSRSVVRSTVVLSVGEQLETLNSSQPLALSPDGRRLAYAARREGGLRLYLRELNAFDARPLPGTDGASYPFFSPDGAWVAFFAEGKLKRQSIAGGSPVTICDVPFQGRGGTWGADGTIVIAGPDGLLKVPSSGGTPTPLGETKAGAAVYLTWPHFLPDGRTLIATVSEAGKSDSLVAVSLETGAAESIGRGSQAQYLPTGHLVFHAPHVREGEVHAVGFDVERLALGGEPVSVLDGVFRSENGGGAHFAVAPSGDLVFGRGGWERTVVRVDRHGRRTPLLDERRGYRLPRISPDGRRLAVAINPRPSQLWVYDLARRTGIEIADALGSAWMPDSQRITFAQQGDIYSRRADGGAPAERLFARDGPDDPSDWSSDGQVLLFHDQTTSRFDIWMWPRGGEPRALVATPAHELTSRLSSDGRWLAYQSDESGRQEIYVRSFPNVEDGKWLVSRGGGLSPAWSPDGRELFYLNGSTLMAVPIRPGPGAVLEVGVPAALFDGPFDVGANNFDVAPDGTFVMIEADPHARHTQIDVVQNWAEDIKRLLPSR
ncbi:MAG: protein kinase domain-containing protein [Acidobacteriota bacterium]